MPLNADAGFFIAKEKYEKARTIAEKITGLEEVIRAAPTHKGAEKLRAQLKRKLAELKAQQIVAARKKGGHTSAFSVKRTGIAQVVLVGYPGSGKSSVLAAITNAKPEISGKMYTTVLPGVGTMKFSGMEIQVIEVPAITPGMFGSGRGELFAIVRNADVVALVIDSQKASEQFSGLAGELRKAGISGKEIVVIANKNDLRAAPFESCPYPVIRSSKNDRTKLREIGEIAWKSIGKMRIYTRKGDNTDEKPFVMGTGSNVRDAVRTIHKEILETFRFARVWRKSSQHSGSRVGLDFVLRDCDVIEIFAK
ncbi:MAG: GTPase [archaeon]